ncbi:heavy metal-associated isoprenylated plant protein 47-like [Quercus suber]|nr:heavy metal-associated isoprenylated plant protein 16 [Quercus suber]
MDGQRGFFRIKKGDEARKKAMKIALGISGVESACFKGQDKDQIEVKGEGIDTAKLAMLLRKKVGYASIVSVAEDKEETEKEEETKIQYMAGTHSHGYNLPPYALLFCEIREPCHDTYACTIL